MKHNYVFLSLNVFNNVCELHHPPTVNEFHLEHNPNGLSHEGCSGLSLNVSESHHPTTVLLLIPVFFFIFRDLFKVGHWRPSMLCHVSFIVPGQQREFLPVLECQVVTGDEV